MNFACRGVDEARDTYSDALKLFFTLNETDCVFDNQLEHSVRIRVSCEHPLVGYTAGQITGCNPGSYRSYVSPQCNRSGCTKGKENRWTSAGRFTLYLIN